MTMHLNDESTLFRDIFIFITHTYLLFKLAMRSLTDVIVPAILNTYIT